MKHKLLSGKKGKNVLLLGNVSIVRGALESGVQFASTFPGTPSSEIGNTFSEIAKDAGIYFEFSANEKVAFEAAAGAAFSGVRSIVSFKHFGLNVATDSVFPVAYVGVDGGMLVVYTDDPNGWSSAQAEQDSRLYAKIAHMPMIEPSNAQECIDYVKYGFELSEDFRVPVFVRLTTRVSHTRGVVKLGKIKKGNRKAFFEKDLDKYYNLPPKIIKMHEDVVKRIEDIRKISEKSKLNFVVNERSKSRIGIVTSGVSYNYVIDAMNTLGIKLPVLKLGMTYPLPEKKIKNFLKRLKTVLVVEELDPYLEREIMALAKDSNPRIKVIGKGTEGSEDYFPAAGEYTTDTILNALSKVTKKKLAFNPGNHMKKFEKLKIPKRLPVFCAGCPHRATFYAVKKAAGKDAVFGGDIGCYILGIFPPFETQDFVLSMGASMGITHGISKANKQTKVKQKVIAFIGDGTFFHAGMAPLTNMVYNHSDVLVVVMDNRITAMTGHQQNPGSGKTGMGDKSEEISIEEIAKSMGIKYVNVIDPFNMKEMEKTVKSFLKKDGVKVIVAKRKCYLLDSREKRKAGIKMPKFEIVEKLSKTDKKKLKEYGCPAYFEDDRGRSNIDKTICMSCGSCVQLCKPGSIRPEKRGE